MGKWLAKFSADMQESQPDIPDILPSVSGLSGPDSGVSVKNTPPHPPGEPTPPLQVGWTIAYMDDAWTLRGGFVDRSHATVEACRWTAGAWMVRLTDGQEIPLSRVRSVGAVDYKGRLYGAWTVREHGYDGEGHSNTEGKGAPW